MTQLKKYSWSVLLLALIWTIFHLTFRYLTLGIFNSSWRHREFMYCYAEIYQGDPKTGDELCVCAIDHHQNTSSKKLAPSKTTLSPYRSLPNILGNCDQKNVCVADHFYQYQHEVWLVPIGLSVNGFGQGGGRHKDKLWWSHGQGALPYLEFEVKTFEKIIYVS